MEIIIALLVIGLAVYWLIRHPIKTMKFVGSVLGLFLLGLLVVAGLIWFISYII